jgi:AcrR family transcriptional regulator
VLGLDNITAAALKLTSQDGYKGLTMAALARRLNVAPSALYNHVASKEEVLRLLEEDLMARVDVSGFGSLPWDAAVRRWARSYRDVFAAHTPLIPVIAVLPVTDAPCTALMYEEVTKGFLAAGWDPARIVDAIVALEAFIFGAAYDVNAPADIFEPGAVADRAPAFSRSVRLRAPEGNGSDSAFSLGLEALISGLAASR